MSLNMGIMDTPFFFNKSCHESYNKNIILICLMMNGLKNQNGFYQNYIVSIKKIVKKKLNANVVHWLIIRVYQDIKKQKNISPL